VNLQIPFPPKRDARVTREFLKDLFEENHFKRAAIGSAVGHFRRIQPVLAAGRLPLGPKKRTTSIVSTAACRIGQDSAALVLTADWHDGVVLRPWPGQQSCPRPLEWRGAVYQVDRARVIRPQGRSPFPAQHP
jgi:hypothetical protein